MDAETTIRDESGPFDYTDTLLVSATYLTTTFGGAPAFYSLWLAQPCASTVVVHVQWTTDDNARCAKLSSDRICFTPENYREPQLVRIDALENRAHLMALTHKVYSLDRNYDRIPTPNVMVKTEWNGAGSFFTFGGPKTKRRSATLTTTTASASADMMQVDLLKATTTSASSSQQYQQQQFENGKSLDPYAQESKLWAVSHMACGSNFSIAVVTHLNSSLLLSWGVNTNGELGLGTTTSVSEPEPVNMVLGMQLPSGHLSIAHVSCGKHHVAVVTTHAKLYTWGNNKYGQLGHGDFTNRLAPQEVSFALASLSSHQRALRIKHTMARAGTNVTHVACGAFHTLFVVHQQQVLSMGYNQAGQLGIGHRMQQLACWRSCVPITIESLRDRSILDVAAGQNHSACILSNGDVYVWGCGDDGRLGVGKLDCEMKPVLVKSLKELHIRCRTVRCGARHTAVISDRDLLYMWGANEFGQLGCGDSRPRTRPCLVNCSAFIAEGVMDVALGEFHSVCVTITGKVFAWGLDLSNENTQIDQRKSPLLIPLPTGERARKVACGWTFTNLVTQAFPEGSGEMSNQSRNFYRKMHREQLMRRKDELIRWRISSSAGIAIKKGNRKESRNVTSKVTYLSIPAANFLPDEKTRAQKKAEMITSEANQRHTAAAYVSHIIQDALKRVTQTLPLRANQRAMKDHEPRSSSPVRKEVNGIFYHNHLHPPELPPTPYRKILLGSGAVRSNLPSRPSSSPNTARRVGPQPGTSSRASLLEGLLHDLEVEESEQHAFGCRREQVTRHQWRPASPAAARHSPRQLGVMESLMHKPSYSIAQSALVPVRVHQRHMSH